MNYRDFVAYNTLHLIAALSSGGGLLAIANHYNKQSQRQLKLRTILALPGARVALPQQSILHKLQIFDGAIIKSSKRLWAGWKDGNHSQRCTCYNTRMRHRVVYLRGMYLMASYLPTTPLFGASLFNESPSSIYLGALLSVLCSIYPSSPATPFGRSTNGIYMCCAILCRLHLTVGYQTKNSFFVTYKYK